jgi:hypothetical protein
MTEGGREAASGRLSTPRRQRARILVRLGTDRRRGSAHLDPAAVSRGHVDEQAAWPAHVVSLVDRDPDRGHDQFERPQVSAEGRTWALDTRSHGSSPVGVTTQAGCAGMSPAHQRRSRYSATSLIGCSRRLRTASRYSTRRIARGRGRAGPGCWDQLAHLTAAALATDGCAGWSDARAIQFLAAYQISESLRFLDRTIRTLSGQAANWTV